MSDNNFLVKEVSKYFRDFLETDFHKKRTPKRQIKLVNEDNLLIGVKFDKFNGPTQAALKLLETNFTDGLNKLKRKQYITNIPKNLYELIYEKIDLIEENSISDLKDKILQVIIDNKKIYNDEYDKFLEESYFNIQELYKANILESLFTLIEKPLNNINSGDENAKELMKIEILDQFSRSSEFELGEGIRKYFAGVDIDLMELIINLCDIRKIRDTLKDFFKNYNLDDLFDEIGEIYNNSKIFEKTELYLYFFDVAFQRTKYPLFFTPITLNRKDSEWTFTFESPLFINRNAIDWIVQEFNTISGKKGTIKSTEDRIIYLNNIENHIDFLNTIISDICHYFETESILSLNEITKKSAISKFVSISNSCYLALFDKSDESIVNDYEEILTLGDDSLLTNVFEKLIDNFINKNPENISKDVESDWDSLEISGKLVTHSPIPLNEEQRKALIALNDDRCKNLVIKGPPGTGKSHTITAIVCDYILNGKSVLMVSDKEEALDVVEGKISETLNSIRINDEFQNPIFRIGKNGNRFNQIVSGPALREIKQHHQIFKQKLEYLNENRVELENDLKRDIEEEIQSQAQVSKEELRFMLELEDEIQYIIDTISPNEILEFEGGIDVYNTFIKAVFLLKNKLKDVNIAITSDIDNHNAFLESEKKKLVLLNRIKSILSEYPDFEEAELLNNLKFFNYFFRLLDGIEFSRDEYIWNAIVGEKSLEDITLNEFINVNSLYKEYLEYCDIIKAYGQPISEEKLDFFQKNITEQDLNIIKNYIDNIKLLKKPIIGFLFTGDKVTNIDKEFRRTFPFLKEPVYKNIDTIKNLYDFLEFIQANSEKFPMLTGRDLLFSSFLDRKYEKFRHYIEIENTLIDNLKECKIEGYTLQKLKSFIVYISSIIELKEFSDDKNENVRVLKNIVENIQKTEKNISDSEIIVENFSLIEIVFTYLFDIAEGDLKLFIEGDFFSLGEDKFLEYSSYIKLFVKYKSILNGDVSKYSSKKKQIETIMTASMASVMDERIIDFSEKNANDVQTLKGIIKEKKKFPKELFSDLKNAFPCIIANIRTYSDFIPLEYEMFDLVIIDEASQVSIAQALPAIFRAKKVIVLGDEKQFSNVKTSQASSEMNTGYVKNIEKVYLGKKPKTTELSLERLRKFNIKSSILDFLGSTKNYEVDLRKHFRGYRELISFSNKYFYGNGLQVMKIRGKAIDEVIKFTILEGEKSRLKNINEKEAKFIIEQVQDILNNYLNHTVGIITPHTEQQRYIQKEIYSLPNREELLAKLKLKVWTFDTCQGEERDTIIYSMVATKTDDKLPYVFIKELNKSVIEEDKIKAQRLNVGLSRAKERMWFVISKPIEEFSDCSIKEALRHYNSILGEKEIGKVDPNSPMEQNVLNWILDSKFYNENKHNIEIVPQFDIGQYLKQLNPHYNHPKYKVDFLFLYKSDIANVKIIIEYDGFKEHFKQDTDVNSANYEFSYKDDDIYRQKVLESYGYTFLRINKFNLGNKSEESSTISEKLQKIVDVETKVKNTSTSLIQDIIDDVKKFKSGEKKVCPKCGILKEISEFKDNALLSGVGKNCISCKTATIKSSQIHSKNERIRNDIQSLSTKEDIIKLAIENKQKVRFYYKSSWRTVEPIKTGKLFYNGYSFYGVLVKESGVEKSFNFSRIKKVELIN